MAKYEFKMPSMGESVEEATITKWRKEKGDYINVDDIFVDVATDKVDSEIPCEVSGVVKEILFKEDEVVKVGEVMAIIDTEGDDKGEIGFVEETKNEVDERVEETSDLNFGKEDFGYLQRNEEYESSNFYSPLVKTIAKEENISDKELEGIHGTGIGGRVTKDDILMYVSNRNKQSQKAGNEEVVREREQEVRPFRGMRNREETFKERETSGVEQLKVQKEEEVKEKSVEVSKGTEVVKRGEMSVNDSRVEVIEMSRMGKLLSKYMIESKRTSAHVQSFVEVDMTRVWNWRNKIKGKFESRQGEKLTFTPIFIEAVVKALLDFPMMNASTDGEKIFKKKYINIGMATSLDNGDLIVPVIKNADQMNLAGLAKSVNDLANRARKNALKPDEIKDGTYTVTNVGTFGSLFGTPIINQPEVGILAIGAIQKVPAVVETPEGDTIAIRYKMILSHSYDHRVVNGALGGMFVQRVAKYLENWDINREV